MFYLFIYGDGIMKKFGLLVYFRQQAAIEITFYSSGTPMEEFGNYLSLCKGGAMKVL